MITRVYIDNFRCFTNFEVRPERVNLLIGNNGAGKSTFIDVLHRVIGLAVLSESVQDEFPLNTLTRWDSRSTQRIELDVKGNDGMYEYAVELSHDLARETVTLQQEVVKYNSSTVFLFKDGVVELHKNDGSFGTKFPFRGSRSFLPELEPRPENTHLTWFLDFLRQARLLKLNPTNIDPESRFESETLERDGSNFASWYRHVSQERPGDLHKLFDRLGERLAGFRTLRTTRASPDKSTQDRHLAGKAVKRELVAVFGYGDPPVTYDVDFDDLSDGERATIVLYCILTDAEGRTRTLLLDEPEKLRRPSANSPMASRAC